MIAMLQVADVAYTSPPPVAGVRHRQSVPSSACERKQIAGTREAGWVDGTLARPRVCACLLTARLAIPGSRFGVPGRGPHRPGSVREADFSLPGRAEQPRATENGRFW